MSEFTTYQKFTVREEALELGDLLQQKRIPYKLEVGAEDFDPSFVFKDEFRILIKPEDFDKVSAFFTEDVEADYYLFSFSDKELMEIIEKQDEWSHFDFILAQKILKERGKEITPEMLQPARKPTTPKAKSFIKHPAEKNLVEYIIYIIFFLISIMLAVWKSIQDRL